MVKITPTKLKIAQMIEDVEIIQGHRAYLGVSQIGETCERKLRYSFRCVKQRSVTARVARLLQRGHNEEPIIIADLKKIGINVHSDQKEVVAGHGHIKGHIDGIAENVPDAPKTPHLLELKTANDKSFKDVSAKGIQQSKPIHFYQMVIYMYLLGLKRGLYIIVNKNNDERYYERIKEEPALAKSKLDDGVRKVIGVDAPMDKRYKPAWYECKWCDYYEICHFDGKIKQHCRTCSHCSIKNNGVFKCITKNLKLTFTQQMQGCDEYKKLVGV